MNRPITASYVTVDDSIWIGDRWARVAEVHNYADGGISFVIGKGRRARVNGSHHPTDMVRTRYAACGHGPYHSPDCAC